jgi:hypothetical protein
MSKKSVHINTGASSESDFVVLALLADAFDKRAFLGVSPVETTS